MAATLFGLALSQQCDASGTPLSGCKLYLYAANSTTPVTSYQTADLLPGQENPWPIVSDNRGRIPSFWLPDGSYHARLTDANDVVQFDDNDILGIGSGSSSEPSISCTGDIKFRLGEESLNGWVKLNGQTLGNVGSGAAVSGEDYEDLFTYLWEHFDDTICAVSGGRFTAGNDWAAGKTIGLLDLRGRFVVGLDDMGAAAANRLADVSFSPGDAVTGGSAGGLVAAGSPGLGFLVGTWHIRM
jgi:hypothetical protein